jgi:hypothetical protein
MEEGIASNEETPVTGERTEDAQPSKSETKRESMVSETSGVPAAAIAPAPSRQDIKSQEMEDGIASIAETPVTGERTEDVQPSKTENKRESVVSETSGLPAVNAPPAPWLQDAKAEDVLGNLSSNENEIMSEDQAENVPSSSKERQDVESPVTGGRLSIKENADREEDGQSSRKALREVESLEMIDVDGRTATGGEDEREDVASESLQESGTPEVSRASTPKPDAGTRDPLGDEEKDEGSTAERINLEEEIPATNDQVEETNASTIKIASNAPAIQQQLHDTRETTESRMPDDGLEKTTKAAWSDEETTLSGDQSTDAETFAAEEADTLNQSVTEEDGTDLRTSIHNPTLPEEDRTDLRTSFHNPTLPEEDGTDLRTSIHNPTLPEEDRTDLRTSFHNPTLPEEDGTDLRTSIHNPTLPEEDGTDLRTSFHNPTLPDDKPKKAKEERHRSKSHKRVKEDRGNKAILKTSEKHKSKSKSKTSRTREAERNRIRAKMLELKTSINELEKHEHEHRRR